ncbi:MAG: hypothetical protein Kow0074_15780 [Candidatus Zixiibacteriota bacterium]
MKLSYTPAIRRLGVITVICLLVSGTPSFAAYPLSISVQVDQPGCASPLNRTANRSHRPTRFPPTVGLKCPLTED